MWLKFDVAEASSRSLIWLEASSRSFATNKLKPKLRLEASATIMVGIPSPLEDAP